MSAVEMKTDMSRKGSSTNKSLQEMCDSLSSVLSAATLWRSLENYHTPDGPCKKMACLWRTPSHCLSALQLETSRCSMLTVIDSGFGGNLYPFTRPALCPHSSRHILPLMQSCQRNPELNLMKSRNGAINHTTGTSEEPPQPMLNPRGATQKAKRFRKIFKNSGNE